MENDILHIKTKELNILIDCEIERMGGATN
jgi:hypothetical protein